MGYFTFNDGKEFYVDDNGVRFNVNPDGSIGSRVTPPAQPTPAPQPQPREPERVFSNTGFIPGLGTVQLNVDSAFLLDPVTGAWNPLDQLLYEDENGDPTRS